MMQRIDVLSHHSAPEYDPSACSDTAFLTKVRIVKGGMASLIQVAFRVPSSCGFFPPLAALRRRVFTNPTDGAWARPIGG